MARTYPRFIYSDPQDTKSKGPFIIHTLFPQFIARVTFAEDGDHYIDPLEVFVAAERTLVDDIAATMHVWFTSRRMEQANLSDDFYPRVSEIAQRLSARRTFANCRVTTSMVFKPYMGARLEIGNDEWEVSLNFANDDTYNSVVCRLKEAYREKYGTPPEWAL
jgi:hypothetical protein